MIGENVAAGSSGSNRRHLRLSSGAFRLLYTPSRRGEKVDRWTFPVTTARGRRRDTAVYGAVRRCPLLRVHPSDCMAIERRFRVSSRELYWCVRKRSRDIGRLITIAGIAVDERL